MHRRTFLKTLMALPLLALPIPKIVSAQSSRTQGQELRKLLKNGAMEPMQIRQQELISKPGQYGMWCEVNPILKVKDIKVIHHAAGSSGIVDPLMQEQTVGFKFEVYK